MEIEKRVYSSTYHHFTLIYCQKYSYNQAIEIENERNSVVCLLSTAGDANNRCTTRYNFNISCFGK